MSAQQCLFYRGKVMNDAYKKHFGQLIGCKIVGFHMEKDEYEMGDWCYLKMKRVMVVALHL